MSTTATSGFDALAPVYDKLWTDSAIGRVQRELFWHHAASLFRKGETILDLGCGTGDDAARLALLGVGHFAIDKSPEMVAIARQRGLNAHVLPIEEIGALLDSVGRSPWTARDALVPLPQAGAGASARARVPAP